MRTSAALLFGLVMAGIPAFAQTVFKVEFNVRDTSDTTKTSRRYTLLIDNNSKGVFRGSRRVPVSLPNSNSYNWMDISSVIDCGVNERGTDGKVGLDGQISFTYLSTADKNSPGGPGTTQVQVNIHADVPEGKPTMVASVDDPDTTRKFEVEATVTKVK